MARGQRTPYLYIDGVSNGTGEDISANTLRRTTLGSYAPTKFDTAPGPRLGHKFIVAVGFWGNPSKEERAALVRAINAGTFDKITGRELPRAAYDMFPSESLFKSLCEGTESGLEDVEDRELYRQCKNGTLEVPAFSPDRRGRP